MMFRWLLELVPIDACSALSLPIEISTLFSLMPTASLGLLVLIPTLLRSLLTYTKSPSEVLPDTCRLFNIPTVFKLLLVTVRPNSENDRTDVSLIRNSFSSERFSERSVHNVSCLYNKLLDLRPSLHRMPLLSISLKLLADSTTASLASTFLTLILSFVIVKV